MSFSTLYIFHFHLLWSAIVSIFLTIQPSVISLYITFPYWIYVYIHMFICMFPKIRNLALCNNTQIFYGWLHLRVVNIAVSSLFVVVGKWLYNFSFFLVTYFDLQLLWISYEIHIKIKDFFCFIYNRYGSLCWKATVKLIIFKQKKLYFFLTICILFFIMNGFLNFQLWCC